MAAQPLVFLSVQFEVFGDENLEIFEIAKKKLEKFPCSLAQSFIDEISEEGFGGFLEAEASLELEFEELLISEMKLRPKQLIQVIFSAYKKTNAIECESELMEPTDEEQTEQIVDTSEVESNDDTAEDDTV
ncbi:uncharacterized protein LOC119672729 [Teleopsis dalmanni]|uniref:uncharacterized protein LOC119672729 n=1 Tax=Teleopsis dalmanni TaxID=139649 RepID=UPI000D32BE61|nr:uncharacterized protein LOC119672729 [Teleopsis dalmanni]